MSCIYLTQPGHARRNVSHSLRLWTPASHRYFCLNTGRSDAAPRAAHRSGGGVRVAAPPQGGSAAKGFRSAPRRPGGPPPYGDPAAAAAAAAGMHSGLGVAAGGSANDLTLQHRPSEDGSQMGDLASGAWTEVRSDCHSELNISLITAKLAVRSRQRPRRPGVRAWTAFTHSSPFKQCPVPPNAAAPVTADIQVAEAQHPKGVNTRVRQADEEAFLEGVRAHGRDAKLIARDMGNRTIGAVKKFYQKNRKCGPPLLLACALVSGTRMQAFVPTHVLAQSRAGALL